MTLQNKRWTRLPYSNIYANKGAKYFANEFINDATSRWEKIKQSKNIIVKPYDGKGDYILITCNRGTEGYSAEKKNATEYAIETIEEIRQNSISNFSTQLRNVTADDYLVRALSMPAKYGKISKAYTQKPQADEANTTLDLYVLTDNINNNFSPQLAYDAGITYKPSKNSYIHLNFQKLPKLGIVNGLNNRVFMNNHFNNSNFLPN